MLKASTAPLNAHLWPEARSQKADILCVQETHFSDHKSPQCSHKLFPHCFLACADKKTRGVMIAVRSSISFNLTHLDQDPSGRYLILSATFNNQPFVIVNIYAPIVRQKSFYKSIMHEIQHYPKDQIIICGNFNDVIDNQMDSSNPKTQEVHGSILNSIPGRSPWSMDMSTRYREGLLLLFECPKIILSDRPVPNLQDTTPKNH